MVCRTSYIYKLQRCNCWILTRVNSENLSALKSNRWLSELSQLGCPTAELRHKAIKLGVGESLLLLPCSIVVELSIQVCISVNLGSLI